jgi:enoyl-CoA hydratase
MGRQESTHPQQTMWLSGHHGQRLRTEAESNFLTITIDNAPVNALDSVAYQELHEIFDQLLTAKTISAVLLRADNRCFCAGQDRRDAPIPPVDSSTYLKHAASALALATRCPVPVVAAVKSAAIGAGLILALTADILVIDEQTILSLPERKFGVISGYSHLAQWLGRTAIAAVLTGDPIDPQAFANRGGILLPNDEVDAEAERIARSIATDDPSFVVATKSGWSSSRESVAHAYLEEIEQTISQGSMNFDLSRSTD